MRINFGMTSGVGGAGGFVRFCVIRDCGKEDGVCALSCKNVCYRCVNVTIVPTPTEA